MSATEEVVTDPGAEQVEGQPDEAEENEQPDAEPDVPFEEPEPEQPEAPPAPAGMSIEELEKVRTKLDTSANTWRRRVRDLLGEEADMLVPCELCDETLPGFHFPAELLTPRDELHSRLLDVLRAPAAPEYRPDPYTVECGTCGGWGKTLTKGHVAGKTERVCPTCKGLGFQSPDTPVIAPSNGQADAVAFDLPSEEPLVTDGTDVWGSPKLLPDGQENPNYGKMPQYKNPTLP
jgi:hypothetical protein